VLDLVATQISAVSCHAAAEGIDATMSVTGAYACRIAPDEALLLGRPGSGDKLVGKANAKATGADPDAVVLDTTDGWAVWTLEGAASREAFARLSAVPLPSGASRRETSHASP
jgi:hypothetical protein